MSDLSAEDPPSPKATALNPSLLLEVTSDSSEEYDTGTKLEIYRTVPSLHDYVVVSHRERRITVHARASDGTWTTRQAISGGRVRVSNFRHGARRRRGLQGQLDRVARVSCPGAELAGQRTS